MSIFLASMRAAGIGIVMFGKRNAETGKEEPIPREPVRLAIPRRVYTQSHVDYIVEVVEEAFRRRERLKPFAFWNKRPFSANLPLDMRRWNYQGINLCNCAEYR